MNKEMRKNLELVINSMVDGNTKAASEAFHNYLRPKTQQILMKESEECDEDEMEDEDEDKDEEDEDKDDKPAFLKKKKKDKSKKDEE